MLILRRKAGEAIVVNGTITVSVLAIKGSQIILGITAPPEILIMREELLAPKGEPPMLAPAPDPSREGKRRGVWEVRDWEKKHPTEEVEAYTNTEALGTYIQKHGIDTSTFHLIEATFLRSV